MNVYKNKHFVKRDYECTNVVACKSTQPPNDNYIEAAPEILNNLTPLWIENGIEYYGFM